MKNFPESAKHLETDDGLAEGARFELAVHEVDAGFQDRWFQPLTHPSGGKNKTDNGALRRYAHDALVICRISIRAGGHKIGLSRFFPNRPCKDARLPEQLRCRPSADNFPAPQPGFYPPLIRTH
jgi:hypothetical protein